MSVSHVLLGLLAEQDAHGYDLKQAHDARFPSARPLAFGQVYAALARLQKAGHVEVVGSTGAGGPERTTYTLSAPGRAELTAWLEATEPAGPYAADELVRKTVTALHLGQDAPAFLARQRRVHLEAMRALLVRQDHSPDVAARLVVDHAVEHLDADLRWLENAAARLAVPPHQETR